MYWVLLPLLLLAHELRTKDLYVSLVNGNDNAACGISFDTSCKTLNYTFLLHLDMSGTKIHLDGGNSTTLTYLLNRIHAVKNVRIHNYPYRTRKPVISSRSGLPMFNVSVAIHLESISFVNINIASTTGSKASLTFAKCDFSNSKIVDRNHVRSKTIGVYLTSCNVYAKHNTPILLHLNNISHVQVTIKNSRVDGSGVVVSNTAFLVQILNSNFNKFHLSITSSKQKGSTLIITDCVFHESTLNLSGSGHAKLNTNVYNASAVIARTWKNLHIYHSNFTNSNKMFLLLKDMRVVTILHSNTRGNDGRGTVLCTRIKVLSITNCTFEDNRFQKTAKSLYGYECNGGALCLKLVTIAMIYNSTFRNNSGIQGGAIYMSQSAVTIKNSTFLFNIAVQFGGGLYSEGNKRISLKHTAIHGPFNTPKATTLIGQLIFSKTAMKLDNTSFFVNSNNLLSIVIVYIDTIQDALSQKHTLIPSSYYLKCPVGYNVDASYWIEPKSRQYRYISAKCVPCGEGKYNLKYGYSYKTKKMNDIKQSNITCLTCPSGGVCNNKIESAGNYWGYVDKKTDRVRFIPCPIDYCCTRYGTLCTSYNTCANNRNGKLCGKCKRGYSLDLLSTKCIDNGNCTVLASIVFWIFYIIGACLYLAVLMYLKEIVLAFKKMFNISEVKKSFEAKKEMKRVATAPPPLPPTKISSINVGEYENILVDVDNKSEPKDNSSDSNLSSASESADSFLSLDISFERKESDDSISSTKRVSGLIKIIFFFYQIEALLRINAPLKNQYRYKPWLINSLISSIFNINIYPENTWFSACPINGLTTIKKQFVRMSFLAVMFGVLFVLFLSENILGLYKKSIPKRNKNKSCYVNAIDDHIPSYAELPKVFRVKACAIKLCLLGYVSMATFLVRCLHCVNIDNSFNLYIQGENDCISSWYYWFVMFIMIVWVAPFCIVLWGGSKLLYSCKISPNEFFIILFFPPMSAYYYWRTKQEGVVIFTKEDAMEAKHYLMELYEPFQTDELTRQCAMWECMVIFRKLILVVIYTLIIHPIAKLYSLLFLIMIYLIHHIYQQPYCDKFLNFIECVSLALLSFLAAVNLFWAQLYMATDNNIPQLSTIGEVFLNFELIVLAAPIIIVGIAVFLFSAVRLLKFYNYSGFIRIINTFKKDSTATTRHNRAVEVTCNHQTI